MSVSSDSQEPSMAIHSLDLFTENTLDNLTNGFLAVLEPEMTRVLNSIDELTANQEEMLSSVSEKISKFKDTTCSTDILNTLQKAPAYKQKLSSVSKRMQALTKRVKRLQQRAVKLKDVRVQKDKQKKKDYELKIQEEKLLEAKPPK